MTKPLAGRVEARIVGTIGGTAHRAYQSAPRGVSHGAGVVHIFAYYQEVPHE